MAKKINGIPHNLVDSFFSTLRYFDGGYMADWLGNGAKQFVVKKAVLDIKKGEIIPLELNIKPLVTHLKLLNMLIERELKVNGLPLDFVVEARIEANFKDPRLSGRNFYAQAFIKDRDSKEYQSPEMFVVASEPFFDVSEKLK